MKKINYIQRNDSGLGFYACLTDMDTNRIGFAGGEDLDYNDMKQILKARHDIDLPNKEDVVFDINNCVRFPAIPDYLQESKSFVLSYLSDMHGRYIETENETIRKTYHFSDLAKSLQKDADVVSTFLRCPGAKLNSRDVDTICANFAGNKDVLWDTYAYARDILEKPEIDLRDVAKILTHLQNKNLIKEEIIMNPSISNYLPASLRPENVPQKSFQDTLADVKREAQARKCGLNKTTPDDKLGR